MKINRCSHIFLLLALIVGLTSSSLWAAEDGMGTNVVRNVRIQTNGVIDLGGIAVSNWNQVGSTSAVGNLEGATNALNTSMTTTSYQVTNVLYGATNTLNTSVTTTSYQVTNMLYGATNALNTSVNNLNARTNVWNNGVIIYKGAGTLELGKLYFMGGGSVWSNANAATNTTAQGLVGLALGTSVTNDGLLMNGQFSSNQSFAVGAPLYLQTNDNLITDVRPFRTNHVVRIVGYAISGSTIMFNPDRTFIEVLDE